MLAPLSVVLNGGGLAQLKTITTELDAALDGHRGDVHQLIKTLGTFVGGLDSQRSDIVAAIEGIDRLSTNLNQHNGEIAHALDTVPGGLEVLNDQRSQLVAGRRAGTMRGLPGRSFRRAIGSSATTYWRATGFRHWRPTVPRSGTSM